MCIIMINFLYCYFCVYVCVSFFRSLSISYYVLLHLTLIVHYFYFQSRLVVCLLIYKSTCRFYCPVLHFTVKLSFLCFVTYWLCTSSFMFRRLTIARFDTYSLWLVVRNSWKLLIFGYLYKCCCWNAWLRSIDL